MLTYPQKITFGEMRDSGVRDPVRLSELEPGFVCTTCGKRGTEVRPKSSQARMGAG